MSEFRILPDIPVDKYLPSGFSLNPARKVPESDGKDDHGKLRYDLITPAMLKGLAEVLTYGAKLHGANTWQKVPDALNRYTAAEMRHVHQEWRFGRRLDEESGLPHLYHAAVNLLFLAELDK